MRLALPMFLFLISMASYAQRSIQTKPLTLNFSVEKGDFPLTFKASGSLSCWGTSCILGFCESHHVDKELSEMEVIKVSEDAQFEHYSLNYKKKEALSNPYAYYHDPGCRVELTITATDPRYPSVYRKYPVAGYAKFESNKFSDLTEADHISLKYFYTWEDSYHEMRCLMKEPFLCSKFMNAESDFNPKNLKATFYGSQSDYIFPKP